MIAREDERLQVLRNLRLLDTAPSESFDRITRMAAKLFDLPIAAVSLTDGHRQWFKSKVGVEHNSIPRIKAPCARVAEEADMLVIPDLGADAHYADSHLAASGIRFYAGAPLVTSDGFGLGALCVLGTEPRHASPDELAALHDLAAIVMSQIELQHAYGRIDPVSQLPNRTQFLEDLDDLALGSVGAKRLAVLVDIGRMDQVASLTSIHGTGAVDDIVEAMARRFQDEIGPERTVYHVGPTQFALLAPAEIEVQAYLDTLRMRLKGTRSEVTTHFVMTPAIGVAPFVVGRTTAKDVLRTAYSAVQVAYGRADSVSLYSEASDVSHSRRHGLLASFGSALVRSGELRAVFQPRIDLASRHCVSVEALLRWAHPTLGPVSPAEFIPVVEQSGLARPMTEWVLGNALRKVADWRASGTDLHVSVNVTSSNVEDVAFVETVSAMLDRLRVPAAALELEITEGTVMGNTAQAVTCLTGLRSLGVRVSIDDFGTGYSSLSYLRRLPIDAVKIDQSFVRNMVTDEKDHSLVRSLVGLSHDLGFRVVAEGVETDTDRVLLERMGCDEGQGYLFARPLEASDFPLWLDAFHAPARVSQRRELVELTG
ncbi:EAL domain-containing protein [Rubellimicrobium rubrum]|uniref:EAL domain-containing protein n=1 Tax=Rubellimicrobium rubrum TaxID=2585369 RepID=A0A5C4MHN1_9RHOB|nr:EAL domain-containing protein [Rubellimicrobium rubrum]TNC43768.1 EAL domain-containing protein [Rubellimicrobium rubrum]